MVADPGIDLSTGVLNGAEAMVFDPVTTSAQGAAKPSKGMHQRESTGHGIHERPDRYLHDLAKETDACDGAEESAIKDHAGGRIPKGCDEALDIKDQGTILAGKRWKVHQEEQKVGSHKHEKDRKQTADGHLLSVMGDFRTQKEKQKGGADKACGRRY